MICNKELTFFKIHFWWDFFEVTSRAQPGFSVQASFPPSIVIFVGYHDNISLFQGQTVFIFSLKVIDCNIFFLY